MISCLLKYNYFLYISFFISPVLISHTIIAKIFLIQFQSGSIGDYTYLYNFKFFIKVFEILVCGHAHTMNYTVAPFELADVQAPCTWSPYVDMFNVWRQCLSFDSRLLDDLFSEHLFAKFQSYRGKVHCSDVSLLRFNQNYKILKQHQMYVYNDYIELKQLKNYTYEKCVSANPNITLFTVQKHSDFAWDYDQLHCFLGNGEDYTEVKERLRQSRYWKRRYAQWSECLSDGSTLLDLCYNKYLEVKYFIENDDIFQQILNSDFFDVFCKNPNVTLEFLKTRVTYNINVPLKKRIITLVNPNVSWYDILDFCHANNMFLQPDFWTNHKNNEFTSRFANYPYLIDYRKLQNQDISRDIISADIIYLYNYRKNYMQTQDKSCDIISAIVQKPDVPDEVVMSLDTQYFSQFNKEFPWIKCEKGCSCNIHLCGTKSKFREKYFVMPIFSKVNLQKEFKLKNTKPTLCGRDLIYLDHRNSHFIKDIERILQNPTFVKNIYFGLELLQNPMSLEKLAFLSSVLTPAAIKIQHWYLRHFYRPDSRYVNTVLRNRFNAMQRL